MHGDLISRRKLDGMRLVVPDFVNPDQRTKGWNDCITYIQQNAPAVDAVPVVHGRWVHTTTEDDDWGGTFHHYACSVCGWSMGGNPEGWAKFCPNCGAKMYGEEDDATEKY